MPNTIKFNTIMCWIGLSSLHLLLLILNQYSDLFYGTLLNNFGLTVVIVPYLLAELGLPVLIENSGWVTLPGLNILGWLFSISFWLLFYWCVAKLILRLVAPYKKQQQSK